MSNSSNSSNDKQDNSINKALESLENTTETTSNEEVVGVEVVKGDKIIYEEGDFEEFNKAQDLDSDSDNLAQDSADSDKDDASQVSKKQQASSANKDQESNDSKETDSKKDNSEADEQDSDSDDEQAKDEQSEDNQKDLESNDSDQEGSGKDKYTAAIANLYQWAAKLKDEFITDKKSGLADSAESKQESDPADSDKQADSDNSDNKDSSEKQDSEQEDKHSVSIANIYQWAAKLKEDFASEASNVTHDVSEKALAMMLTKLLNAAQSELKAFDAKLDGAESPTENSEEERSKIAAKKDKYQGMIDLLQGE